MQIPELLPRILTIAQPWCISIGCSLVASVIWYLLTEGRKKSARRTYEQVFASNSGTPAPLAWSPTGHQRSGLPEIIPYTANYVSRPVLERNIGLSIETYRILKVEGPSGIGKTCLLSKVIRDLSEESQLRVIWYESQPSFASFLAMLCEDGVCCGTKIDKKDVFKTLSQSRLVHSDLPTILVIDNFQELTPSYLSTLEYFLTHTRSIRFVLVSKVAVNLMLSQSPGASGTFPVTEGFTRDEARLFISRNLNIDIGEVTDVELGQVYDTTAKGLPRALANYIAARKIQGYSSVPLSRFSSVEAEQVLDKWTQYLLTLVGHGEMAVLRCLAVLPSAIEPDLLMRFYKTLHPLRHVFGNQETGFRTALQKLRQKYYLEFSDNGLIGIHESVKEALRRKPETLSAAHRVIANSYLRGHEVQTYNRKWMSAKEFSDKWQAVFHYVLGEKYKIAASILSEIYPFLNRANLHEDADRLLSVLYNRLGHKAPWLAWLYATRAFDGFDYGLAATVIQDVCRKSISPELRLRFMTLQALILLSDGQIVQAEELTFVNLDVAQSIKKTWTTLTSRRYDSNIDLLIARNLRIQSDIAYQVGNNLKGKELSDRAQAALERIDISISVFDEGIGLIGL